MNQEKPTLVGMEKRLIADRDGVYLGELKGSLSVYLKEVRERQRSGLPPQEYEQAHKLENALTAALRAVDIFWRVNHDALC